MQDYPDMNKYFLWQFITHISKVWSGKAKDMCLEINHGVTQLTASFRRLAMFEIFYK